MAKNQDNMFGSFGSSLNERVHEQAHTEAVVTGQKPHPGTVGRPRKRVNAMTMIRCYGIGRLASIAQDL